MRHIIFLIFLCYGAHAQSDTASSGPATLDEFIGSVEGISLKISNNTLLYKFMLESQAIKANSTKVRRICDSMIGTIPASSVTENDFFIWKCSKEQLISWLGDLDKYAYVKPQIKYVKRPFYPENAREESGDVVLSFDITESGAVENIQLIESSNYKFNDAAVQSAKTIQYVPAHEHGEPIRVVGHKFKYSFSPH